MSSAPATDGHVMEDDLQLMEANLSTSQSTSKTIQAPCPYTSYYLIAAIIIDCLIHFLLLLTISFNSKAISYFFYIALGARACGCIYLMWSVNFVRSQNALTLVLFAIVVRICIEGYNPQQSMPNSTFWAYSFLGIVFTLFESKLIHQDYLKSYSIKSLHEYTLINPNTPSKINSKKRIEGMDALRFIASIHIVIYHFYLSNGTEQWKLFAFWGRSAITFFFILSGFVLSYQYAEKCSALTFSISDFWLKRIAGRYPSYLLYKVC